MCKSILKNLCFLEKTRQSKLCEFVIILVGEKNSHIFPFLQNEHSGTPTQFFFVNKTLFTPDLDTRPG